MSCDIIIIINGLTALLGLNAAWDGYIGDLKEIAQKILDTLYPKEGNCVLADEHAERLHSKMHALQDWIAMQPSATFYADILAFIEDLGAEAKDL